MKFDTYFRLMSYAVVICGVLSLLASGGADLFVTALFIAATAGAWRCENSKWQFSERMGLVLIVLALPLYYLDWQYQLMILARERAGAATLAHLIMGLSVIKLFQVKNDRDWVFLYLISFFEVLLAAGLSISPTFLATLFLYLLTMICTIIAFEIRKSERSVKIIEVPGEPEAKPKHNLLWRFPVAATVILIAISVIAVPLFFMMPRVGGAGMGGGGGVSSFVGFSDEVNLGSIGTLQQNSQVVMRVRIDEKTAAVNDLRWRGMVLDTFNNKSWRRNIQEGIRTPFSKDQNGSFKFGTVDKASDLTVQTVYLEPIDTNVIFGAPRIVAVQGNFPLVHRDINESLTRPQSGDRAVYKVYSDTSTLDEKSLRADRKPYSDSEKELYLQLPKQLDERIAILGQDVIRQSGAKNRYDAARSVERYLQTQYGYTLDLKAGGDQPLADFLFNIREGHCEYFATAMAVMLRTQGVATRIVNGFQSGDYNDAADAYIVTQKEAHSWVEVYFPESDSWVTFDPTPPAGRNLGGATAGSFLPVQIGKYFEAFQMFWLQYVVAYDNQEQRSLARSFREQLVQNQERAASVSQVLREQLKEWWDKLRGVRGAETSFYTVGQSLLAILLIAALCAGLWFLSRRISWRGMWARLTLQPQDNSRRVVEFYERMTAALAKQNLQRGASQTPLEFAAAVGAAEAVKITEAYNRVRFGEQSLTPQESSEIERWLKGLELAKNS